MHSDAGLALADILDELGSGTNILVDADWLPRLRATRAAYENRLEEMVRERSEVMHPAALARAMGDALPDDALAVYDGGHTHVLEQ